MVLLIIDVNTVPKIYPTPSSDHVPLYRAIASNKAAVVYGGKLRIEYLRLNWFRRILRGLDQRGAARLCKDAPVDQEARRLRRQAALRSNDEHILALAIVSTARVLCSDDNALCEDFKDRNILPPPRGKIYRRASHDALLR